MRISLLLTFILTMGVSGCSSQKKLVAEAPFEVDKPACTKVIGGREASGMGFELEIPVNFTAGQEIDFSEVYFRGYILPSETETREGQQVVLCAFQQQAGKPDIVMDADPYKEVGNQPPNLNKGKSTRFPFTLEDDEAVLSYSLSGREKVYYYKVTGIKEKPARIYPSKPSQ